VPSIKRSRRRPGILLRCDINTKYQYEPRWPKVYTVATSAPL